MWSFFKQKKLSYNLSKGPILNVEQVRLSSLGEMSFRELPVGEMLAWRIVCLGNCALENCLLGNCPSVKCLWGTNHQEKVCQGIFCWGTVLQPTETVGKNGPSVTKNDVDKSEDFKKPTVNQRSKILFRKKVCYRCCILINDGHT